MWLSKGMLSRWRIYCATQRTCLYKTSAQGNRDKTLNPPLAVYPRSDPVCGSEYWMFRTDGSSESSPERHPRRCNLCSPSLHASSNENRRKEYPTSCGPQSRRRLPEVHSELL